MIDIHPKFRPIRPQAATANGQRVLLLQDPLHLAEQVAFIPWTLAPMLALCDGSRDLNELRASLLIRAGLALSIADLEHIFAQLDAALLLDNERSSAALQAVVEAYRAAPFRPANLAGAGYPAEPGALQLFLDGYLDELAPGRSQRPWRGLVSPHIDYQRGGPVYAQVWSQAAETIRDADLVVLLGTDHNGGDGRITLTRQDYATPYGPLPTDTAVVDILVDAIGQEAAFGEELHHRSEHSIELAAVWLHHMRGGKPVALVPILTGSFYRFVLGESAPADDPVLTSFVPALRTALQGRAAVVVAAGDLAHIGPAFAGRPVDSDGKTQLERDDEQLIRAICDGDAEAFFRTIQAEGDRRNICGLHPIYLALQVLESSRGELTGYDRCPADADDTSFVSICGIVLE